MVEQRVSLFVTVLLACVCGCKDWTQECIGFFFFFFFNLPNQPLSNIP